MNFSSDITYYGLLESEFTYLMEKEEINSDFRKKLQENYNGYFFGAEKLYNIWSVTNALYMKVIENYFSRKDFISKIVPLFKNNAFSCIMKQLLARKVVPYPSKSLKLNLYAKDLCFFASCCKGNDMKIHNNILLQILFQGGYLTLSENKKGLLVPNLAILRTLEQLYISFFKNCGVNSSDIDECAKYFPKVSEDEMYLPVELFCKTFKKLLLSIKAKVPINHQVIHSLLFLVILRSNGCWTVISLECPVTAKGHSKRCDITFFALFVDSEARHSGRHLGFTKLRELRI